MCNIEKDTGGGGGGGGGRFKKFEFENILFFK